MGLRDRIIALLDRLPGACWAELVAWASGLGWWPRPWSLPPEPPDQAGDGGLA